MHRRRRKPDPLALAFGQVIRDHRAEPCWTLEELAERMGATDGRYLGL